MKFLWCDTETTGLSPDNAAPFQIAFIFVSTIKINDKSVKDESERVFYLNCLDMPHVEFSEEAAKVHGYSEEKIRSFESSKIVVGKIFNFLTDCMNFRELEKMYFCGYNSKEFDFNHLDRLFKFYGYDFSQFFQDKKLDVFDQVKLAGQKRILPYLPNRKLTTIAEHLKIDLSNAHDALSDIKATREVAKSLSEKGIPLK